MNNSHQISPKVALGVSLLLLAAPNAQAQAPISVDLNGRTLTFSGTQPTQIKGSTLVPMRGIFEALGASVRFDSATQTVFGQRGQTAIVLPLGALTATVDGKPTALPQPAQLINGTTLVPLRFISEALGAGVRWDPATRTVLIQTIDPHLTTLPAPPTPMNGTSTISGQVTGVYTNTTPTQITLRIGGQNTVVPLSAATILLRSETGQAATQIGIKDISPGDQVSIQRTADGTASIITATFGQVKGKIVGIGKLANGNTALTLDSGRVVELAANAPITFDGRKVEIGDIKPYESVVIRTNPDNSLGYSAAVVTADTPNPTPPGAGNVPAPNPGNGVLDGTSVSVDVTSFTTNADKPLRAGDVLTATLAGSPSGKADFSIPGVADNLPMTEISPGVYEGRYTIPKNVSAANAAVLGRLVRAGVTSALIQAPNRLTVDSVPPKVTDFGPAQGATVESQHPLIYATLSDGSGTGVNPTATRITVDGKDMTGEASLTPSLFTLKPADALASGPHTVSVSIADAAGNVQTASWSFKVSTGNIVRSFTTNEPAGQTVGAGSTIVFTLNAQPGGKATATVGGLQKDIPLTENSPGVYVGEYTVKAGDSTADAPVSARFVARDGTVVTSNLASSLTVSSGPPPAPRILDPQDSAYINADAPLTVKGKAAPGSTVRVTVSYESKALGGILPVRGESATKDVVADKDGDWTAEGLSLKVRSLFGANRDTVFTITATRLDSSGKPASDDATITVRPG